MSYDKAAKCFEENVQITDPRATPKDHNLNVGLYQLVLALQQDIQGLRHEVAALRSQR